MPTQTLKLLMDSSKPNKVFEENHRMQDLYTFLMLQSTKDVFVASSSESSKLLC